MIYGLGINSKNTFDDRRSTRHERQHNLNIKHVSLNYRDITVLVSLKSNYFHQYVLKTMVEIEVVAKGQGLGTRVYQQRHAVDNYLCVW